MNPDIACEALAESVCVEIRYHGYSRIAEAHAVGVSTAHRNVMRVWQVSAGSLHNEAVGWKLRRLDEMTGLALTGVHDPAPSAQRVRAYATLHLDERSHTFWKSFPGASRAMPRFASFISFSALIQRRS
jgi:hypothetical protein